MPIVDPPIKQILFYCYGQDDFAIEAAKQDCKDKNLSYEEVRIGKMDSGIVVQRR